MAQKFFFLRMVLGVSIICSSVQGCWFSNNSSRSSSRSDSCDDSINMNQALVVNSHNVSHRNPYSLSEQLALKHFIANVALQSDESDRRKALIVEGNQAVRGLVAASSAVIRQASAQELRLRQKIKQDSVQVQAIMQEYFRAQTIMKERMLAQAIEKERELVRATEEAEWQAFQKAAVLNVAKEFNKYDEPEMKSFDMQSVLASIAAEEEKKKRAQERRNKIRLRIESFNN